MGIKNIVGELQIDGKIVATEEYVDGSIQDMKETYIEQRISEVEEEVN